MFTQRCPRCNKEYVMDHVSPTMGLKQTGEKCAEQKTGGRCRGVLCDTILDWEDSLPTDQLNLSDKFCKAADLAITIGSSLQIVPAANLPLLTKKNGGKVVIINLQQTKHDKKADLLIRGYADDIMRIVMNKLNILVPSYTKPVVRLCSDNKIPDSVNLDTRKRRKRKSTDIKKKNETSEIIQTDIKEPNVKLLKETKAETENKFNLASSNVKIEND
nr:NAD-dependent protein deacetylase sirtuin-6 [Ciona intestinalis]|eukprot:XP_009860758.1 NAD-dependent protein deacetylase sirtuin-6 [Ciona intestinalis]